MNRRTLHSWLATLILVGLIVLGFGLDWRAMLWADPFEAPPAPTQHHYWHVPVDEGTNDETPLP